MNFFWSAVFILTSAVKTVLAMLGFWGGEKTTVCNEGATRRDDVR
jgi:hypothetical protein